MHTMSRVIDVVKNRSGQSVLLMTFILCVIFSILLYTTMDLVTRTSTVQARDLDQLLLDEATSSAFAVTEAALVRRLWEPPPDDECLKSETFTTTSTDSSSGLSWTVTAKYDFETRNYELLSIGEINKNSLKPQKAAFKKLVRIMDVSDYLLFSGSDQEVVISQITNPRAPAAMIAKDRRVYINGPLRAAAGISRSPANPKTSWNGSPEQFPDEYGMILQGERLQFKKGISYSPKELYKPNSSESATFHALTAPFTAPGANSHAVTHWGQKGMGNLVIMRDSTLADELKRTVEAPSLNLVQRNDVDQFVYPIALFSGTPPLLASTAVDNGSYFSDTDRYSFFRFNWSAANYGTSANFTCLMPSGTQNTKNCSNSEHFPNGFKKWRADAGLENVLYTSDTENVPVPELGWEQLEALEEDAQLCGAVVSSTPDTYEDCQIWDFDFLSSYSFTGAKKCLNISRVNLNNITFANFDLSQYQNEEKRKRSLRRVVFLKTPATLQQTEPEGIFTGISDDAVRESLAVWLVSTELVTLQGYQDDTTSPMDSNPEELRAVWFNSGKPGVAKQSMPVTLLANDAINLISPFYKPMTEAMLESRYPVVGGKIRPRIHNLTDHERWNDDGYKYGYRQYNIKNMTLITNATVEPSRPFYLQGLWSAKDPTGMYVFNQCLMTLLGNPLVKYPGISVNDTAQLPADSSPLISGPNAPLPPKTSRFYGNDLTKFPREYVPGVFAYQAVGAYSARRESLVKLTGGRIHMKFSLTGHPTKPDVTTGFNRITERYNTLNAGLFDLSQRGFQVEGGQYENTPPDTPCIPSNWVPKGTSGSDPRATAIAINDGVYTFMFEAPGDEYKNAGAFTGIDMPLLEVGQ